MLGSRIPVQLRPSGSVSWVNQAGLRPRSAVPPAAARVRLACSSHHHVVGRACHHRDDERHTSVIVSWPSRAAGKDFWAAQTTEISGVCWRAFSSRAGQRCGRTGNPAGLELQQHRPARPAPLLSSRPSLRAPKAGVSSPRCSRLPLLPLRLSATLCPAMPQPCPRMYRQR
jgi:hypothetical protein